MDIPAPSQSVLSGLLLYEYRQRKLRLKFHEENRNFHLIFVQRQKFSQLQRQGRLIKFIRIQFQFVQLNTGLINSNKAIMQSKRKRMKGN